MTCLTPPGRGAIAVLAVRGALAWPITRELFRRRQAGDVSLPENPDTGKTWLGRLGEATPGGSDEVVLVVRDTAPVWLELHCHGGPEVVRLLQELYEARGVGVVPWPDFERTHLPAWKVAAAEALAEATTSRTAAIALDQWHGAYEKTLEQCRQRWLSGERESAVAMMHRLKELVNVGRHLTRPWRVVLAGPPNAGKSSLGNALAGYARSLVAPTPGTTRDVVTTTVALDGWPVELSDTAGWRLTTDALERAGIARAQAEWQAADLSLWLIDGAAEFVAPQTPLQTTLVVINKTDLPRAWDWDRLADAARVSALTGAGVPELIERMVERLVPRPPTPGEGVPHTEEQCDALDRITTALREGDEIQINRELAALA